MGPSHLLSHDCQGVPRAVPCGGGAGEAGQHVLAYGPRGYHVAGTVLRTPL